MKRSLTTLAAVLLLSAGAIGAAQAKTIAIQLTMPTGLGDNSPFTGTFTDAITAGGTFTDDIVFAGPPPAALDVFKITAGTGLTFTSVSLNYYSGGSVPLTGTFTSTSVNESTEGNVISALYDLKITGTATAGASYSGTITSTPGSVPVAAVPEPESWALMLAGLGATGLFMRSRRQRQG